MIFTIMKQKNMRTYWPLKMIRNNQSVRRGKQKRISQHRALSSIKMIRCNTQSICSAKKNRSVLSNKWNNKTRKRKRQKKQRTLPKRNLMKRRPTCFCLLAWRQRLIQVSTLSAASKMKVINQSTRKIKRWPRQRWLVKQVHTKWPAWHNKDSRPNPLIFQEM